MFLLFRTIEDIKSDLERLTNVVSALHELGFTDDHPALVAVNEKTVKLQAELNKLEEDI